MKSNLKKKKDSVHVFQAAYIKLISAGSGHWALF